MLLFESQKGQLGFNVHLFVLDLMLPNGAGLLLVKLVLLRLHLMDLLEFQL